MKKLIDIVEWIISTLVIVVTIIGLIILFIFILLLPKFF